MKIIFATPRTPREDFAGLENYTINLAKELKKKKHKVKIFATAVNPKKQSILDGIDIKEFKEQKLLNQPYYSKQLIKEIWEENSDIVHLVGFNNLISLFATITKPKNKKIILTLGSSGRANFFKKIMWYALLTIYKIFSKNISVVIAISNFEKQKFKGIFQKIKIIPIGFNIKKIEKIKIKHKKNQIISIGRLVRYKGFDKVIKAFSGIVNNHPKTKLLIVGSGPERKNLEKLTEKLKLKNKVTFYGAIPYSEYYTKTLKLMKESKLFVFLSDYESQGIVVSEALLCKTPVLTTTKSALNEFCKLGLAEGVNNKNSKECSNKIKEILDNPKKYLPKKEHIKNCYLIQDWKQITNKTLKIYEEIISSDKQK